MYASYLLGRQTDVVPVDRGRGFLRPRIMHEEKGGRDRERESRDVGDDSRAATI